MQPIIKYTGSKRHFAREIASRFPLYNNAFLPFCGGGSFLPYLSGDIVASDLCRPLIYALKSVQISPEELLQLYSCIRERYIGDRNVYYEIRDKFNSNQDNESELFYILTRLCFNGLIRWNSDGKFNTSCHFSRDGIKPEKLRRVFSEWKDVLSSVEFVHEDYSVTFGRAKSGDFVLCDPPYLGTSGQYQSESFNFGKFWNNLRDLSDKGVRWMVCLDHNLDLTTIPNIYSDSFLTSELSSSFNRLKMKNIKNGNTILVNYSLEDKE